MRIPRVMLINRYGGKGVDFDVHCVVATHHMADEGHDHDSADLDYVVTFNPVASIEKVRTVTVTPAVHSVFVVCLVCLSFVGSVVRIACVVCALAPLRSCDTRIHMVALAGWAACCHAVHHHANMQVEGKGYSFRNTASSQLSDEFNLPCQTVDSSQGKGNMMVWGKADWDLGLTGRGGTQRNASCTFHCLYCNCNVVRTYRAPFLSSLRKISC